MSPSAPAAGRLHSLRAGTGEPLVLLHGIGSCLRIWAPVLPALERAHDVLALDLPGFGGSPPLPDGRRHTVPALADGVEAELDAAGIETAHLAGNSLGGWVALELARRGRARTVVGISPSGLFNDREAVYVRAILRLHRTGARLLARWADALTAPAALRTLMAGTMTARPWRMDAREAAYGMRMLAGAPAFDETLDWCHVHRAEGLEDVRVPVLIAWGTRDQLLFPRQAQRFVRRLPTARVRFLPGLGHLPQSDDPELVSRVVLEHTAAGPAPSHRDDWFLAHGPTPGPGDSDGGGFD